MKALVLSCNTGEGHNTAGRAIQEACAQRGIQCDFADALRFTGEFFSKGISGGYVSITQHVPRIFKFIYDAGGAISSTNPRYSPAYLINRPAASRMGEFIREGGYDTVFLTHLFPAETITALHRNGRIEANTFAVATDYTCYPFWAELTPTRFVSPHALVNEEYTRRGIHEERLLTTGIPVSPRFSVTVPRDEARRRLDIPQDRPAYLMMSGSMGFGHLDHLADEILRRQGSEVTLLMLCGRNERLTEHLRERYANCENVRLIPFTKEIPLYMDASDVLFTKPGGLTSTEAIVKRIPIIHTSPIPGCETSNAAFFHRLGLSYHNASVENQAAFAQQLVTNPTLAREMRAAQAANSNPNAAFDIVDYARSLLNEPVWHS